MQTGESVRVPQRIGVPRETFPGEKRVATVPDVVAKLIKLGFAVVVERGAGELADLSDEAYAQAGASIVPDAAALWQGADIVFKVRPPTAEEVALMHAGQTLIGFVWPAQNPELMQQLAAKKVTRAGAEVHLTPTEFRLLARLVRQAGQVVTHRQLLADVWGPEHVDQLQYLRLYMGQLRAKLEVCPADPQWLLTEPGVGYRLAETS